MDRRDFMKRTVLAGAAASVGRSAAGEQAAPASDRVRLGFIGCGARAVQLLDIALSTNGVDVVALCDAYTGRADRAREGSHRRTRHDLQGLPGNPRPAGRRRRVCRHARPLAQGHGRGRDGRREGRVRREADDVRHRRGPRDHRGGQANGPRAAGRQPGRERRRCGQGARGRLSGAARPDHDHPRRIQPQHGRRRVDLPIPPDASPATIDWEGFLGPRRNGRSASSVSSGGAATGTTREASRPICSSISSPGCTRRSMCGCRRPSLRPAACIAGRSREKYPTR
jgi:hypothetical protein